MIQEENMHEKDDILTHERNYILQYIKDQNPQYSHNPLLTETQRALKLHTEMSQDEYYSLLAAQLAYRNLEPLQCLLF